MPPHIVRRIAKFCLSLTAVLLALTLLNLPPSRQVHASNIYCFISPAPVQDAYINYTNDNEYGYEMDGYNQQLTPNGQTWYLTWDDNYVYVAMSNAALAEAGVLYIGANLPSAPYNGGSDSNGNLIGFNYDMENWASLPFRANFVIYFKDGDQNYHHSDGSGGWGNAVVNTGNYASTRNGNVRELSIPWSAITGSGRPAQFAWMAYVTSVNGYLYGQVPLDNPGNFIGLTATADHYYLISDTSSGSCTAPFSVDANDLPPTSTPTSTNTATSTNTPTDTPTATNTPTNTSTNTSTLTSTPSNTATLTSTPTSTNTATSTPSNTATYTPSPSRTPSNTATLTNTATNTATSTNTFTATSTSTNTATYTASPTNTPSNTPTMTDTPTSSDTPTNTVTSTVTPTQTDTYTPTETATPSDTATVTNTPTATLTNTATLTDTPSDTPSNTLTNTATPTLTLTATASSSPTVTASATASPTVTRAAHLDTIGINRGGKFYLRLYNSTGYANINVTFSTGIKPYPIVGDWTGAGVDTVGVFDQSNGLFTLCTVNDAAGCSITANQKSLVLGVPNDLPLSGRWLLNSTNAGVGVFRPSNGLIYLKNTLTTGYADHTMVLGVPSDIGLTGDWNGKGFDSPGVYRPSNSTFYLSNQITNGPIIGDYQAHYGLGGDLPITGDWVAQGHDGIGLFRQSNGFTYLKNQLVTGYADNTFTFGIPGDQPLAGHWQAVYPPVPAAPILIARTAAPSNGSGVSLPSSNLIGD